MTVPPYAAARQKQQPAEWGVGLVRPVRLVREADEWQPPDEPSNNATQGIFLIGQGGCILSAGTKVLVHTASCS